MEKRTISGFEVKFAATEEATLSFSGYGAKFGNVDAYGDVISPGAFAASLAAHKAAGTAPLMFLNHDSSALPIGVWTSLAEDGEGLVIEGKLLDTAAGRDAYLALKAGAITGLSIGYRPVEFQLRAKADEPRRTLKAVDLMEVSLVNFPANTLARINDVKSMIDDDPISALTNSGFSLDDAKRLIATIEAKYKQAAALSAALNLLSKITKENNVR